MSEETPIPLGMVIPQTPSGPSIGKSALVLILAVGMIVGLGSWFAAGTVRDAWDKAAAEENYDKTHTQELDVSPSVTGWKFHIDSLITDSRSGSDGAWFGPKSHMKTYFYDTNDRDVGIGQLSPAATPIEDANYVKEIVQNIKDPDFPKLSERTAVKCWTHNNPIIPPKSDNYNIKIKETELKITFTVQYTNAQGDIDDTATKSCSFKQTVYYYEIDPGAVGSTYMGPYKTSYSSTYLYVPFNVAPRYNMITLYVQGETEQIVWEDEFGGNYKESSHLGPQPLTLETPHYPQAREGAVKQPVKYSYPLNWEIESPVGVV